MVRESKSAGPLSRFRDAAAAGSKEETMSTKVFAHALCQLIGSVPAPLLMNDPNGSAVSETSDRLMKAFLDFGSETDDNMNCFRHVEYGRVDSVCGPSPIYGLKLKGKEILLVDIIHMIEDLDLPREISEQYPDLTEAEWSAITRMATMMFCAFELHD
jgi:hypothetical protein